MDDGAGDGNRTRVLSLGTRPASTCTAECERGRQFAPLRDPLRTSAHECDRAMNARCDVITVTCAVVRSRAREISRFWWSCSMRAACCHPTPEQDRRSTNGGIEHIGYL